MNWYRHRRAALILIAITVVGCSGVGAYWIIEFRTQARLAQVHGKLAFVYVIAHNTAIASSGGRLPRINGTVDPPKSWRVACSTYVFESEHEGESAVPTDAPIWLRSPRDDGPATDTSFVMIYSDTHALNSSHVPWAIAEVPQSGIRWNEPRDMTIDQFIAWAERRVERGEEVPFVDRFGRVGTLSSDRAYFHAMTSEHVEWFLFR